MNFLHYTFVSRGGCEFLENVAHVSHYSSTIIIMKFVDFQKLIYKISLYGSNLTNKTCWMNYVVNMKNFSYFNVIKVFLKLSGNVCR